MAFTNSKDTIPDSTKRFQDDQDEQPTVGPSSSLPPPPTFEESAKDDVILNFGDDPDAYVPAGGEEPPPSFAPYNAEFFVASDGSIVSHDPHLNDDGEALYRFLLSQLSTPPSYVLHCKATHTERRTRFVHESDPSNPNSSRTKTESYTEEVTDFDFHIDATPTLVPNSVVQWTVGDEVPAYRGTMVKEVIVGGARRRATRAEIKRTKEWDKERIAMGLPPWVAPWPEEHGTNGPGEEEQSALLGERGRVRDVLNSSWTLRQWADDYCSSPKYLKEFTYEKVVYGWNTDILARAIRSAILSIRPHYTSSPLSNSRLTISFLTTNARISIRPSTSLSRALSNPCLKFLLIITLIYPFIYLFKRFHESGGGKWEVGGAAYALKRWTSVTASEGEGGEGSRRVMEGTREGEWFERWEGTIRRAVAEGRIDRVPVQEPNAADATTGFTRRLV